MNAEGDIAAQKSSSTAIQNVYSGQKLISQTTAGVTTKFLYDAFGNVNCITTSAWVQGICPAPTTSNNPLKELYSYDYKNRQIADVKYNTSGAVTDLVSYTYDALDRVVIKSEKHGTAWTSTWTFFEGDSTS